MKLEQISLAGQLANRLRDMIEARAYWVKFEVTGTNITDRINGHPSDRIGPKSIPSVMNDDDMNCAIYAAIITEYDRRIAGMRRELGDLGVEFASASKQEEGA